MIGLYWNGPSRAATTHSTEKSSEHKDVLLPRMLARSPETKAKHTTSAATLPSTNGDYSDTSNSHKPNTYSAPATPIGMDIRLSDKLLFKHDRPQQERPTETIPDRSWRT